MITNLQVHFDKQTRANAYDWQAPVTFQIGERTFAGRPAYWNMDDWLSVEFYAYRDLQRDVIAALLKAGFSEIDPKPCTERSAAKSNVSKIKNQKS